MLIGFLSVENQCSILGDSEQTKLLQITLWQRTKRLHYPGRQYSVATVHCLIEVFNIFDLITRYQSLFLTKRSYVEHKNQQEWYKFKGFYYPLHWQSKRVK